MRDFQHSKFGIANNKKVESVAFTFLPCSISYHATVRIPIPTIGESVDTLLRLVLFSKVLERSPSVIIAGLGLGHAKQPTSSSTGHRQHLSYILNFQIVSGRLGCSLLGCFIVAF
jgi:hypothetical protein